MTFPDVPTWNDYELTQRVLSEAVTGRIDQGTVDVRTPVYADLLDQAGPASIVRAL